jgi:PAS domain S-box-containing protein
VRRTLAASGEVGRDLLAVDWSTTSVGPPDDWPNSLRTAVRMVLSSKFSMWMAWGPDLIFFCNDSYRRATLGSKYPWALGRPATEVWSEIWPEIGPRIERVLSTGEATWDEDLMLFLERSGYVEESYHTFSYSPLADDDGRTAGMLCVVTETTQQIISVQRIAALRDLGAGVTGELTEVEAISSACRQLATNSKALPFCLVYLFTADGTCLVRTGATGFPDDHPAAPKAFETTDPEAPWPGLDAGEVVLLDDLETRFTDLPTGAWDEPPTHALAVPIVQPTLETPYGYLIVGLNRHRPFDDPYRDFVTLIAGHLSAALTAARAYEFERQRAETLARIDQSKTDFFTNVSHEFRTPLTLLLGPAEDALRDTEYELPAAQRDRVEVIRRNGQRLLTLVNNLLDFSRLESERTTTYFEPIDLAAYTAELVGMFREAAERAGLSLEIDCPALPQPVPVDREHWAKIVLNLVSNAVKFTFDGQIRVSTRVEHGDAVLVVADTGEGIPEDEMPHLFERFHRVRGGRSRTHEGSGIGLALVAELTELHGGTASAESAIGEGTTFTIRIPLEGRPAAEHPVHAGASQIASSFLAETARWTDPERPGQELTTAPQHKRSAILVVDDNADMRAYIAGLLREEYDVVTAIDGVDALEQLPLVRPDLVLTDVMMPRLDGFGLIARIQADPLTTSLPVIMVSARGGEEGTVEGLEAGAADYLIKPFSARELLARVRVNLELDRITRVRSTLERSEALLDQAQRLAKVGSFEVDLERDTLTASDELVRLFGRTREEIDQHGYAAALNEFIHPDDRDIVLHAIAGAAAGSVTSYEARVVLPSGGERLLAVRAEAFPDDSGTVRFVRGSAQDITERRNTEQALMAAAARDEAAAREHSIADELQRSLLPARTFDLEHLDVATYYKAGVEGTQVGGDWYDIIELSRGRTAFVIGDVMGRGVSAAAVMGQMRSAVRALATLALPPTEVMQHLDTMVQDLAGDQIVTCVYGVYDPADRSLRYANAGHLPPLLSSPTGPVERLTAGGPPLGVGYLDIPTETVHMRPGSSVTFYTDGLVERRGDDIDLGINALIRALTQHVRSDLDGVPERLVQALLPDGPDDDVAILIARVSADPLAAAVSYTGAEEPVIASAREHVVHHLRSWGVPPEPIEDMVLMTSELFTNAVRHGETPVELRIALEDDEIVLEIHDHGVDNPAPVTAADQDEHGRGLFIVSTLATRWGHRYTETGKTVWCVLALDPDSPEEHSWT